MKGPYAKIFKDRLSDIHHKIDEYSAYELYAQLIKLSLTAAEFADVTVEVKISNEHRHKTIKKQDNS